MIKIYLLFLHVQLFEINNKQKTHNNLIWGEGFYINSAA